MARSIYDAAAQGLESGFGLGLRARAEERATRAADDARIERVQDRATIDEQRAYQRTRDVKADERMATQDRRLAEADARNRKLDELKLLDTEFAEIGAQAAALAQQFGGFERIPPEVQQQIASRSADVRARRAQARQSFYSPGVEADKKEAAELWSRLETGQMKLDQLTPDQLYKAIQVQARRPLADFRRGPDGAPSVIEQAAMDLEAGVQTGNEDLILRAANQLLKPELQVGVGTEGRDGSEIVSKEIVKLAPHPQNPEELVPIVKVTVKRNDGATGSYLAPVSEGRGVYASDPSAMPKTISVQAAFDRVGQLASMAQFVNHPNVTKELDRAKAGKTRADEFLTEMGYLGVAPPKKQITRERVDLGGQVLERDVDAAGNILGERRLGKTPTPRAAGEGVTAEMRNADAADRRLDKAVKDGLITPEEAREQRRKNALGGSGKGAMTSPADQFKAENTLRDEYNLQTKTFTIVRDAYGKVLAAAKEQKAGPDQTAAADIALIFAYMRMLDPNSVVREGEFATAQNAAGIPDRIRNYYNRALSGNLLNDKQRNEITGEARKVFGQQRKSQDEVDKRYLDMAKRYELNPDNVVTRMEDPDEPPIPPAARAALKEGQVTTFRNGERWTLQGGRPVQVQ
jgi:hypothetical protein